MSDFARTHIGNFTFVVDPATGQRVSDIPVAWCGVPLNVLSVPEVLQARSRARDVVSVGRPWMDTQ